MTGFDERYQRLSEVQRKVLDRWLGQDEPGGDEPGGYDASGDPAGQRPIPGRGSYQPPATAAERILADVWQEVLDVPQVGIDDDYFELGGDSIHAIVVTARAEAAGQRISTQDLLEARTIRQLAQLAQPVTPSGQASPQPAESVAREPWPSAQPAGDDRDLPLTPMQQGLLFHVVSTSRPLYVAQVTCQLEGDLDVTSFTAAWQAVVDQHAALRRVFQWPAGGTPTQRSLPHATVSVDHRDWRGWGSRQQQERLADYLAEDLRRGFQLDRAPLLRLALLRTAEAIHHLIWTHHHLLLDGWSQQLVLRDVLEAYGALRAGREVRIPDRDTTAHLEAGEGSPVETAFWLDYLRGYQSPGAMPASVATGGVATGGVATGGGAATTAAVCLPEPATLTLTSFCREQGVPLSAAVMGAWAAVLAREYDTDDVVFGITVSGRSQAEPGLTEAIGMFINTIPLRVRYQPSEAVTTWLHEVHRQQRATVRFERTALPAIVRASGLPSGQSLFESIVVLENFPDRMSDRLSAASLRIGAVDSHVDEGYPLVVEVTPGHQLTVRLRYDTARFADDDAAAMVDTLVRFLGQVPAKADGLLAEIMARIDDDQQRRAADERAALRQAAAARLPGVRRTSVEGS